MAIKLPRLPYQLNALEPHVSSETLRFHHGKHHRHYVDTLNKLIVGTLLEKKSLEEIMRVSFMKKEKIYNNAAQVWNHNFLWNCMTNWEFVEINLEQLPLQLNSGILRISNSIIPHAILTIRSP